MDNENTEASLECIRRCFEVDMLLAESGNYLTAPEPPE